jgi:hypothetical protein
VLRGQELEGAEQITPFGFRARLFGHAITPVR